MTKITQKKTTAKKSIMERLGLKKVRRLSVKICRDRVKHLRAGLEAGRYRGELREKAEYYANWYNWMAKNGGHRGHGGHVAGSKKQEKMTKAEIRKAIKKLQRLLAA